MKKHIIRLTVYAALLCVPALVLTHPYIWQSLFGPKIRGVPVYAWQHDTRVAFLRGSRKPSLLDISLELMGFHVSPTYIDGFMFPTRDPEMLPILITLADDRDELVRGGAAFYLGELPKHDEASRALKRLANDQTEYVRVCAQRALDRQAKAK